MICDHTSTRFMFQYYAVQLQECLASPTLSTPQRSRQVGRPLQPEARVRPGNDAAFEPGVVSIMELTRTPLATESFYVCAGAWWDAPPELRTRTPLVALAGSSARQKARIHERTSIETHCSYVNRHDLEFSASTPSVTRGLQGSRLRCPQGSRRRACSCSCPRETHVSLESGYH